jgi:hypothetical protein
MADHVRKQIRDAVVTALTGLATTGTRVFENRTHELQDTNLPGLRIYTNDENISTGSMGSGRLRHHTLDLVVECCSKKSSGMDDELDAMIKEVTVALDANQGAGGAKFIEPRSIQIDMDGEAEKEIGVARITFEVPYYTAQGAPDVAH